MEVAAHLDWDSTMYQLREKAVSHLWTHEKLREKKKDLYIRHCHETRMLFGDLRKSQDCSGYLVNNAKKLQKKVFHSQNFDANWTRNALIQSLRIYKCLKQFFFFQTPLAMSSKLLCSCQENLNCPQLAISR